MFKFTFTGSEAVFNFTGTLFYKPYISVYIQNK